MEKIIMEKIRFKTIISQQTCFACQILPFCVSAWHVPCTGLSPLSIVDTSVFQMKPISVFFLLPVFHINPIVFEIPLCPNLTSPTVYVLKPYTIVELHGTKSTLGGHVPQQNLPLLLLLVPFRFSRYTKHQAACCLLQRTLHSYPSSKATGPSHSPVLSCDASHFIV